MVPATHSNDSIEILDNSQDRKYFTIIPNCIDDFGLSIYAVRLYLHLKRVAGENGRCWQSTATLAANCHLSAGTISKSKKELVNSRLIRITSEKTPRGGKNYHIVEILDIWEKNLEYYKNNPDPEENTTSPGELDKDIPSTPVVLDKDIPTSPDELDRDLPTSPGERTTSPGERTTSPGEIKKNPIKKNPIKKIKREEEEEKEEKITSSSAENSAENSKDSLKTEKKFWSPTDAEKVIRQVTGFVTLPSTYYSYLEKILDLLRELGLEITIKRLQEAWNTWNTRLSKNGLPYKKSNSGWIDWAIANESIGQPQKKVKSVSEEIAEEQSQARQKYREWER